MFDLVALIFIFSNVYYLSNYKRLDEPFRVRDFSRKLDLLYYTLKVFFLIWIVLGYLYNSSIIYALLISMVILRIPIYYLGTNIYNRYHRLLPPINIILLISLLFNYFID